MKMAFKIFIFLFSVSGLIHAQGGWKKKYYFHNSFVSTSSNVFETNNGNFICIGITFDTINNKYFNKLTLTGINSSGDLIWRKDYGDIKFMYLSNVYAPKAAIYKENNAFLFTVGALDSNNKYIGVLIKFNFNGDTLWQKIYRDSIEDVTPQGITKSVGGGYLITGWFQNNSNYSVPCMILKTDKNGNELWRKKIHKIVPDLNYGIGILQDSVTKKIIIVGNQNIGNSNSWAVHSNVLILDSLGNKILQTTFNNARSGGFLDVIQLKDGNYLSCGAWQEYYKSADYLKGLVVKFDINGNVIWSKKYFTPAVQTGIRFAKELNNSDIVLVATIDSTRLNPNIFAIKTALMKIDKNGNQKLFKIIGTSFDSGISETPSSINTTSDGGFIIATQFPNMHNPTPYSVIKVDSTFCDTSAQWCESVALPVTNFNKLTGYSFEMYPNPANEILHFRIDAPSEKTISIIINDLNAKQIEKLEIEANTDSQLNTSNYQAGIYFVSILINGTAIETKKLVIVR